MNPKIYIRGVWLRCEGDYVVVYIEREDGKSYEAIRELAESPFSHHISSYGIACLTKLDWLELEKTA